ncbi:MAG: transposase, partial [Solirubrobacteraceae bacterium]
TIQVILDEELERLVGAGPYERSDQRVDVRNGRYDRLIDDNYSCRAATITLAGRRARPEGTSDPWIPLRLRWSPTSRSGS